MSTGTPVATPVAVLVTETARHQVAIAGQVTDAVTQVAMASVDIVMIGMPAEYRKKLALFGLKFGRQWNTMSERPDRTLSRRDGLFYFLDLPPGSYTLRIASPALGRRYGVVEQKFKVARDANGRFVLDWAVVSLPPTSVKGSITAKKAGLSYAEVRVKGSGERAFTDKEGSYLLAGIEPGKRTLLISAQGYRALSQAVVIEGPGAVATANVTMVRETSETRSKLPDVKG